MILKFIEAPLLQCRDEAEAIAILNDFLAELGKKSAQESKIQQEEEAVKVREGEDGGEGGGREGRGGGEGGRRGREGEREPQCISAYSLLVKSYIMSLKSLFRVY